MWRLWRNACAAALHSRLLPSGSVLYGAAPSGCHLHRVRAKWTGCWTAGEPGQQGWAGLRHFPLANNLLFFPEWQDSNLHVAAIKVLHPLFATFTITSQTGKFGQPHMTKIVGSLILAIHRWPGRWELHRNRCCKDLRTCGGKAALVPRWSTSRYWQHRLSRCDRESAIKWTGLQGTGRHRVKPVTVQPRHA